MATSIQTIIAFDHFDQIAQQLRVEARGIVGETVRAIAQAAQADMREDTSSLKKSVYVAVGDDSTYADAAAAAESANPGVVILPEEKPENDTSGLVGVAASHGEANEYGTTKMPANPALTTATEAQRPVFDDKMGRLLG